MDSTKKYDVPNPKGTANFISKLLFWWTVPLFRLGYARDLDQKDLYNILPEDESTSLGDALEKNWELELKNAKSADRKPSLLRAINRTFIRPFLVYTAFTFLQSCVIKTAQPVVLAMFLRSDDLEQKFSAAGIVLMSVLSVIIIHQVMMQFLWLGMRCRVACGSLMYRKLLRLDCRAASGSTAGHVVNLLSNDVSRFDMAPMFLPYLWLMPVQAVTSAVLMYWTAGSAAMAGLIFITVQAVPVQGALSRAMAKLRMQVAHRSDDRVRLVAEFLSAVKVVKMYAWEPVYDKLIGAARALEMKALTTVSYLRGFSLALMVFTERTALYITLVTHILTGHPLAAHIVFSLAQFFNNVQLVMAIFFPAALVMYGEARVSVGRIEKFLLLDEQKDLTQKVGSDKEGYGAEFIDVRASWVPNSIADTLCDVKLKIPAGSLCMVAGAVGAGKTSLLQVLLGELTPHTGRIRRSSTISYVSQEPWLFSGSLRDNILLGQQYQSDRYARTLESCALLPDLEMLPRGDRTPVGERGASLSGGQRARVALARAVYRPADLYLLDDPLAAVDARVARHLFNECIVGMLGGSTRILVTHQVHLLRKADVVVLLENGRVRGFGTYEELKDQLEHLKERNEEETEALELQGDGAAEITNSHETPAPAATTTKDANEEDDEKEPEETQELMEKGELSGSVYGQYIRAAGSFLLLSGLCVTLLVAQAASSGADYFVTFWTTIEEERHLQNQLQSNMTLSSLETNTCIYIYSGCIVASIILTILRSILYFNACMNASGRLHTGMWTCLSRAPLRQFSSEPAGRVLNRFSRDVGAVDELLPRAGLEALQILLVMSGILFMVVIVQPWMLVPVCVLAVLFYQMRRVYLTTAQSMKRLDGILKSPVLSHVSDTLHGLATVRAAGAQAMLARELDSLQDAHTRASVLVAATSCAFGFLLDVFSVGFLTLVVVGVVVWEPGAPGLAGLAVTQALVLTGMLQHGMRQTAEVTAHMTSVERVLQYTRIDPEEKTDAERAPPPADWPQRGHLQFRDVSLRYAPHLPPAIHRLDLDIGAGQKVGIVGRTGAGKSSLVSALFRLAPFEGSILLDGVDTCKLSLGDLRSRIAVIPQEPVLFAATLRQNLDPLTLSEDAALWRALQRVQLQDAVGGLEFQVSDAGSNLSAGQRQLVCVARAVARSSKLLVLDEATASVDPQTDALIHSAVRDLFSECTVLTIAHRLHSVAECDVVLVMDAGRVTEKGHPHDLLQVDDGVFAGMVRQLGSVTEQGLRQNAQNAYEKYKDRNVSKT